MVEQMKSDGIVAASTEYLRRAGLYGLLPEALKKLANAFGLPIWDRSR